MIKKYFEENAESKTITFWDTSNVKNMKNSFYEIYDFNTFLLWNVSNVKIMCAVFESVKEL